VPKLLERVVHSWGARVPKLHLSSPRDPGKTAHADRIAEADFLELETLMADVAGEEFYDVMLEAKLKDRALLELMTKVAQ
jgi:UV DNA damage endonuclease